MYEENPPQYRPIQEHTGFGGRGRGSGVGGALSGGVNGIGSGAGVSNAKGVGFGRGIGTLEGFEKRADGERNRAYARALEEQVLLLYVNLRNCLKYNYHLND